MAYILYILFRIKCKIHSSEFSPDIKNGGATVWSLTVLQPAASEYCIQDMPLLVPPLGFEPRTQDLKGPCSNQLSYRGKIAVHV